MSRWEALGTKVLLEIDPRSFDDSLHEAIPLLAQIISKGRDAVKLEAHLGDKVLLNRGTIGTPFGDRSCGRMYGAFFIVEETDILAVLRDDSYHTKAKEA